MCKQGYMLRISNRGAGVREVVTNTTYEVNIPTALRGKQVTVEVISGLITLDVDKSNFPALREVGILTDIGAIGADCETEYGTSQFQSGGYSTLFDVALQNFNTTSSKTRVPFHTNEKYSFRVGSLPERFTFSTYHVHEAEVALGNLVAGDYYKILTVGTTNFTAIGADSNTVGEVFVYNGVAASGSGTVISQETKKTFPNEYYCSFVLKIREIDDE